MTAAKSDDLSLELRHSFNPHPSFPHQAYRYTGNGFDLPCVSPPANGRGNPPYALRAGV
jgi:hypothetical protein